MSERELTINSHVVFSYVQVCNRHNKVAGAFATNVNTSVLMIKSMFFYENVQIVVCVKKILAKS